MASPSDLRAAHLVSADAALSTPRDQVTFLEVHPWRASDDDDPIPGHVPGAFLTSLTRHFAGTAAGTAGHLPLPDPVELARAGSDWGAGVDSPIVVYARRATEFSTAARAWFTLRWAGFTDVRVLDGQLPAWVQAGGPLGDLADEPRRTPPPALTGGGVPTLDAEAAALIAQTGSLLDARPLAAFAGREDDARTGHIPGAVSAPSSELVANGHLRSSTDIRKWLLRHRAIGQPAGAYCGGGVGSATTVFAAATVGESLPLYVASWSGWSADPDAVIEQSPRQPQFDDADC